MTARVIDIRTRRPVVNLRLVQYDDLQVEHARKIERMLAETERVMAGERPSDSEPQGAA